MENKDIRKPNAALIHGLNSRPGWGEYYATKKLVREMIKLD